MQGEQTLALIVLMSILSTLFLNINIKHTHKHLFCLTYVYWREIPDHGHFIIHLANRTYKMSQNYSYKGQAELYKSREHLSFGNFPVNSLIPAILLTKNQLFCSLFRATNVQ